MTRPFLLKALLSLIAAYPSLGLADVFPPLKETDHLVLAKAKIEHKEEVFVQNRQLKNALYSGGFLILDELDSKVLLSKNAFEVKPIASLTKLMTAMIVEDARLSEDALIAIKKEDVDTLKNSHSRLSVGLTLTRADALLLALMSSDNRAAHALARTYPGGKKAFVMAMNQKAAVLRMHQTYFVEPTGLSPNNVSNPYDIAILVKAAKQYPLISEYTTTQDAEVMLSRQAARFSNTNAMIRNQDFVLDDDIDFTLSKTGHINEAGFCLAFSALIDGRPVTVVLLAASSKYRRTRDLTRITHYLRRELVAQ